MGLDLKTSVVRISASMKNVQTGPATDAVVSALTIGPSPPQRSPSQRAFGSAGRPHMLSAVRLADLARRIDVGDRTTPDGPLWPATRTVSMRSGIGYSASTTSERPSPRRDTRFPDGPAAIVSPLTVASRSAWLSPGMRRSTVHGRRTSTRSMPAYGSSLVTTRSSVVREIGRLTAVPPSGPAPTAWSQTARARRPLPRQHPFSPCRHPTALAGVAAHANPPRAATTTPGWVEAGSRPVVSRIWFSSS
ncbi:hypothetical protein HEB94_005743 [Actinopolymorpha pittospori]|uniref:Uncharacterized protein n=1 Tax=Actinopolymorpha pittospori TaxID=648752 RepID=A0A927RE79_9ACTN|nr:hypothetical protein [Actinopolymorpha pittospori]